MVVVMVVATEDEGQPCHTSLRSAPAPERKENYIQGPLRESNSGPRPPEGRIIPLDQAADAQNTPISQPYLRPSHQATSVFQILQF